MAIAFLISSATEIDPWIEVAVDFAKRLDSPLAILCFPAAQDSSTNSDNSKTNRPSSEASEDESQPVTAFTNRVSYLEDVESRLQDLDSNVETHVFEIPLEIVDIRQWLLDPPSTDRFGRFYIETLFIPTCRGSGVEDALLPKNRLFETVACEAVYVCVNEDQKAPIKFGRIASYGTNRADKRRAAHMAIRLGQRHLAIDDYKELDESVDAVVVAIAGKASQTRIDNNKAWNELRKKRELPMAMVVNPADSAIERMAWSIDQLTRRVFEEYQMSRSDRERLSDELKDGSRHSPEFILFMSIATILACIGLIQNSAAVIIGAMLVAPLMTPLLGAGLAMIQGNRPLFQTAIKATVIGVSISFAIGMLVGVFSLNVSETFFPDSKLELTAEMISRSHPSLLDPFIGFAGGLAGGFVVGRDKKIGALAGVAIAAALVPPLATAGLEMVLVLDHAIHHGLADTWRLISSDPTTGETRLAHLANHLPDATNVRLVAAPIALFLMNACAVILGAFIGLELVGMHRSTFPKESKPWVTTVGVILLLAVIVLLMAIPVFAN